jgi:hypothetical protein
MRICNMQSGHSNGDNLQRARIVQATKLHPMLLIPEIPAA